MLGDADIAAAPASAPDVGDAAGTGGTMIYTSGTTGKPKGAVRAGCPDPETTGALLTLLGYRPDDIYMRRRNRKPQRNTHMTDRTTTTQ
jgi:acyl-coenzyme A synthetase/AMP-(fatty) acid ligase